MGWKDAPLADAAPTTQKSGWQSAPEVNQPAAPVDDRPSLLSRTASWFGSLAVNAANVASLGALSGPIEVGKVAMGAPIPEPGMLPGDVNPMVGYTPQQIQRLQTGAGKIGEGAQMMVEHPSIIPTVIGAAVSETAAKVVEGFPTNARTNLQAWGGAEALTDAIASVIAVYKGSEWVAGKLADHLTSPAELKKLMEASKGKNRVAIQNIVKENANRIVREAQEAQQAATARTDSTKARLDRNREENERRRISHEQHIESLNRDIEKAQTALDKKKVDEIQRIKSDAIARRRRATELEHRRLKELNDAHSAAIEKANREYTEAVKAAEQLEAGKIEKLNAEQRGRLRRQVNLFNQRANSSRAAIATGFPEPDGVVRGGKMKESLSGRLVNWFETSLNIERARMETSPIYRRLALRISDLSKDGKTWGASASGVKLRQYAEDTGLAKDIRGATESDVSTYMRSQWKRVSRALEQTPAPEMMQDGTVKMHDPVPVNTQEVLNVVSELRDTAWGYRTSDPLKSRQLIGMADEIEKSVSGFVGEEFMPRKAWSELRARHNRLTQFDVGEIAAGRKKAEYVPVAEQDRKVPIENVEKQVFANSTNINQLRTVMQNDEEFGAFLDQHIANELDGKTSKEVEEWISKTKWLDHIDEPWLKPKLQQYVVNLAEEEGVTADMAKRAQKLSEEIANHEANLQTTLKTFADERAATVTAAGRASTQAQAAARVEVVGRGKMVSAQARGERQAAGADKIAQEQALAASLLPEQQAIAGRQAERAVARRSRREAQLGETAAEKGAKREIVEAKRSEVATKATTDRIKKAANDLDRVILSDKAPVAYRKFQRLKADLQASGIMSPADIEELETALRADVDDYGKAQQSYRRYQMMRKWKSKLFGGAMTAVGAGGVYGAYKAAQ